MPDAKVELLKEFLEASEAENLYLVGDMIDLEYMQANWYWPESHGYILRKILARALASTQVVYIPGNHDNLLRNQAHPFLEPFTFRDSHIHETADGKRLLLIHGDQFDETVKESPLLDCIGAASYEMVQAINRGYNRLRSTMGYPYWSLAGYFKTNLTRAAMYIERFESVAIQEARRQGVDGLVCGHIHKPNIKEVDGILYCNDGDWVDSCSALVEHPSGRLELIYWLEERAHWPRLELRAA
jgi:UDP-2,3-diacylglucosamine pyrophosphatase LpxH